jgi:hypothetical protein
MNPSPSPVGELVASGCSAAWGSPTSLAAETWIALGVPVVLSSAWGGGKLEGCRSPEATAAKASARDPVSDRWANKNRPGLVSIRLQLAFRKGFA